MGAKICSEFPVAKELYDRASNILGYDLYDKVNEYLQLIILTAHIFDEISRFEVC